MAKKVRPKRIRCLWALSWRKGKKTGLISPVTLFYSRAAAREHLKKFTERGIKDWHVARADFFEAR